MPVEPRKSRSWLQVVVGLVTGVVALAVSVGANVIASTVDLDSYAWIAWITLAILILATLGVEFLRRRRLTDEEPTAPQPQPSGAESLMERAAEALAQVRSVLPLIQAELAGQEKTLAELAERSEREREDADRNEARAKLHAEAAQAVRDLVVEASHQETVELRRELLRMEKRARRDQIILLVLGAVLGAILGVVTAHLSS
jgi:hypothetical protein